MWYEKLKKRWSMRVEVVIYIGGLERLTEKGHWIKTRGVEQACLGEAGERAGLLWVERGEQQEKVREVSPSQASLMRGEVSDYSGPWPITVRTLAFHSECDENQGGVWSGQVHDLSHYTNRSLCLLCRYVEVAQCCQRWWAWSRKEATELTSCDQVLDPFRGSRKTCWDCVYGA